MRDNEPSQKSLRQWSILFWIGALALLFLGGHATVNAKKLENAGILGYYTMPTIHGDRIVFSAGGDLWSVDAQGGLATQLTSHPGEERYPRFSPDGRWLAFSAMYENQLEVYLMPANGGMPKRLTQKGGPAFVVGWTPDSKYVIFRSYRRYHHWNTWLYKVPIDGSGLDERIKIGYAANIALAPDGHHVAFNRSNREGRTWKRYTGGWAQDIWFGDITKQQFARLTTFPGTDTSPMWYKGRIYFISDRTGIRNIYSISPKTKKIWQHTFHKVWDVRWASLGGDFIVYQLGADIWKLDLRTNKTQKVPIRLLSDAPRRRKRYVYSRPYYENWDLGPKGKRLLLNIRGDIFNIPVKEGVTFRVANSSGSHEKFVAFSPNGKYIAAISDMTGEEEVVLFDPMGEKPPKVLTTGGKAWRFWPQWSPDSKWIAFSDKNLKLWIASVKTGKLTFVDQSKMWEIRNYKWSPDSRYLAYVSKDTNDFHSIFIYDTKKKKIIRATRRWTDDYDFDWSPDGKRLYFISRRKINPILGTFDFVDMVEKSAQIYALILAPQSEPPFAPKDSLVSQRNAEEKKAAKKAKKAKTAKKTTTQKATTRKVAAKKIKKIKTAKKGKKKCQKGKKCKKKIVVKIIEKGLLDRAYELPKIPAGHYFALRALKGRLLFMSYPTIGLLGHYRSFFRRMKLWSYSLKAKRLGLMASGIRSYTLSANLKYIALHQGRNFRVFSTRMKRIPKGRKGLVNLRHLTFIQVDPVAEWKQIFMENWRLQRDFYWAPNMAGVDWKAVRDRYIKLIPRLLTRRDLNDLIGQVIGELGNSHSYVWGGDYKRSLYILTARLGAKIIPDPKSGFYRIMKVYRGAPWAQKIVSPLAAHHLKIKKGTYLLAINGHRLHYKTVYHRYLRNKVGKLVALTINDKPTFKGARRIVVKPIHLGRDRYLQYIDWVESRRRLTEKWSHGKVAYIHLPDMSGQGLLAFYRMWYPQLDKRAMVIDVRGNRGGFVSQLIIQKLMRKIWAFFKARNAPSSETVPFRTFHGHVAVVTNQNAGSDGDIFCKSFQLNKLGPVFGTRTWGGVVGIRANKRFVDRGLTTQPEFAWWTPSLGWSLENRGVIPDYEVDNTPADVEKGFDRQLKATVDWLLAQLKKDPKTLPKLPPYPDKSVKAFRELWKKWQAPPAPSILKQKTSQKTSPSKKKTQTGAKKTLPKSLKTVKTTLNKVPPQARTTND